MFFSLVFASLLQVSASDSLSFSAGPVDIKLRGYIQNDFRVAISKPTGNGIQQGDYIFNEASFYGQLNLTYGEHVQGVFSIRPVYSNFTRLTQFNDLLDRSKVDPFWFELDNAFIEITDMGLKGLDLRIGRQSVIWGAADKFNPTNNLNSRDFYDPFQFGPPLANQMIMLRYQAKIPLQITAIYTPMFRPARLPPTATYGFKGDIPVMKVSDQRSLSRLRELPKFYGELPDSTKANLGLPATFGPDMVLMPTQVNPQMPGFNIREGNAAVKVSGSVKGVDLSLSYLYGRWDLPVGSQVDVEANVVKELVPREEVVEVGPYQVTQRTLDQVIRRTEVVNVAKVVYPRMHVLGFDLSTSIDKLGGLGLWVEGALFFPQKVDLVVTLAPIFTPFIPQLPLVTGAPLTCAKEKPCPVVSSTPFPKVTVGVDYTFARWMYANLQYMYGFVDEFGWGYLHHYAALNADIKPWGDNYLFRLTTVVNFEDGSTVMMPNFTLKAFNGIDIVTGALVFIQGAGGVKSKFGNPQNGNTQVFLKGRLSF